MYSRMIFVTMLIIFNFYPVKSLHRQYISFAPTPVNIKLNAAPLSTLTSATPLSCMRACVENNECRSFNMGAGGRCELLKSYLCDKSTGLVSEMGAMYYDVDKDNGDGSLEAARLRWTCKEKHMCSPKCDHNHVIGSSCQNEADCHAVSGGTCEHGKCQCKAEFHYRQADDTCINECSKFANTFTPTRGYALPDFNDVTELSGHTLSTCMWACLNAGFTCRSFEFGPSAGACLLSSKSCSDVGSGVCGPNVNYDYFSRDCL